MIYTCEVCSISTSRLSTWTNHYNTEKHKINLKNATHICNNCHSTFIYKKTEKSKKIFETHIEECKKNIINEITKSEDNDLIEKIKILKEENKLIDQLEKENIKFKGEIKFFEKSEKENSELKNEIKELKNEIRELKLENKSLNDKVQQILEKSSDKVQNVLEKSGDKIEEYKNDIMKICDKQLDFAKNVSKDSNKITSSAMTLLGFLQKQCPNAPPLLEFTKDNYEYTFIFDKDFVYDMLYAFDNDTVGEFIGKIINEMFLKDNKEDQSMFATDTVRLNYSIKEYINENKNKWTLDKGANKVKSIIINPLLIYFIKELKMHLQKENNKMMLAGTKKSDDYIDSDDNIKKIEYKEELHSDNDSDSDSDSDKSEKGWMTPKNKKTELVKYNSKGEDSDSNNSIDGEDDKQKNKKGLCSNNSDDSQKKKECEEDDEDYMLRPIKNNKKEKSNDVAESLDISNKNKIINPIDIDKIKNPHKYHAELSVKERDAIIKQSVKIMQLIKAIEDGFVAKDVLKFITKFYQLDKSYFE